MINARSVYTVYMPSKVVNASLVPVSHGSIFCHYNAQFLVIESGRINVIKNLLTQYKTLHMHSIRNPIGGFGDTQVCIQYSHLPDYTLPEYNH